MNLDEVYKVHYYSQVSQQSQEDDDDGPSVVDPRFFRFDPCNLYQYDLKRS